MKLNLQRPLIVFDLETTGLDLVNDRIIQISYIKVHPDGKEERENLFINPQKPIPQEVEALTHITNDMVKDAPTFAEIAQKAIRKVHQLRLCRLQLEPFRHSNACRRVLKSRP